MTARVNRVRATQHKLAAAAGGIRALRRRAEGVQRALRAARERIAELASRRAELTARLDISTVRQARRVGLGLEPADEAQLPRAARAALARAAAAPPPPLAALLAGHGVGARDDAARVDAFRAHKIAVLAKLEGEARRLRTRAACLRRLAARDSRAAAARAAGELQEEGEGGDGGLLSGDEGQLDAAEECL